MPPPSGPARVRPAVVSQHATQFEEELPERAAGTQQEEAAASYILGHLQQAGYVARLEAVPLANTVNSTDVITVAPGGKGPSTVVAVPYDTGANATGDGQGIGVFLELARALKAARPTHSVEFAALGAERTMVEGGHLGSRRLARLLVDAELDPVVITIEKVGGALEGRFGAFGADAAQLLSVARDLDIAAAATAQGAGARSDMTGRAAVFRAAGLDHVAVMGGVAEVGRVLLEVLS
jgi:Zn-dependent M28 family amino/carboxypeptidase